MIPFLNGLLTGLFLQLALGPVFFYILGITMDSRFINSLAAITAVTLVDYIYITLSLIGIGSVLQNDKIKKIFGLISSLILILFGGLMFYKGFRAFQDAGSMPHASWTLLNSFTSSFILTASSPLTIVFWSSIFSAKAIEKNYRKPELVIFGIGTGLSTFIFLTLTMMVLSMLKSTIPGMVVQILNCAVGLVLMYYGLSRITHVMYKEA